MSQMMLTFTPTKSTVYVNFTCSGYDAMDSQECVLIRVVKDGVAKYGTNTTTNENDGWGGWITAWNVSLSGPITVTPGVSTTIKIQWKNCLADSKIKNYVATDADGTSHRTLTILE
jgi:hypothetical protein